MFNQYQQGLPVDVQQLMHQPLQITPVNPPYVPQLRIDPRLMEVLPLASAMIEKEITEHACMQPLRPLRALMFNLYAQNNFANELTTQLIAGTMDYVAMCMAQGLYNNLEYALQDSVPKVIEMTLGYLATQYPAIQGYLDPQTQHHCIQMSELFRNTTGAVERYKQQRAQTVQTSGFQNGWNPQGGQPFQQAGGVAYAGGGGNYRTQGGGNWRAPNPQLAAGVGSGGVFGGGGGNPGGGAADVLAQPYMARPTRLAPTPAAEPVVAEQPVQQAAAEPEFVELPAHDLRARWKPQLDLPYFPAYNPEVYELVVQLYPDGGLKLKFNERNPVDYDRHAIPSVFGPAPTQLKLKDTAQQLDALAAGVDSINRDAAITPDGDDADTPHEFSTVIKKAWIADTSLASAWLKVTLESLKSGEPVEVYRAYASVAEVAIAQKDESSMLQNFAGSMTFIELREKLNASVNDLSPSLWALVDRLMTGMVNRLLRQNLSLPTLSIESFAADIGDLVALLKPKYGNAIAEAFLKDQRTRIWNTLSPMASETLDNLMEDFIDPAEYPEGRPPKFTAIATNYSLTYLNCRAHDLNIELNPHGSAAVMASLTPVLSKLIEGVFTDGDSRGTVSRFLLRTSDNRVLEATRGLLGDGFVLLTLIE